MTPPRPSFQVLSPRGLDHGSLPMRLWHKAKKHGIWDPQDIDLAPDREDWRGFDDAEREFLLHLTAQLLGGEEAVTLDLLPLIGVIAAEGRLEEEMYLTSFLWEEAKHVETFRRFYDEVAVERSDLTRYHGDHYRTIFYQELPAAMGRLRTDASPAAQAEASVTYNMIVEGVLAETAYHLYGTALEKSGRMPGLRQAVAYARQDESRHLAYGVFLLSRLMAEHGEPVWQAIERRMGELLPPALGVVQEIAARYEVMPFGLDLEEVSAFALSQFQRRLERIERARHQTVEEVLAGSDFA